VPALLSGEVPPLEQPNYFAPQGLSSGAILAAIESCEDPTASEPNPARRALKGRFCGCAIDAALKNKGVAPFEPKRHAASYEQLKRCAQFSHTPNLGETASPFGDSLRHNSLAIADMGSRCESGRTSYDGFEHAMIYCSCIVDALVVDAERPVITPDEKADCEQVATYRIAAGSHMTLRQFAVITSVGARASSSATGNSTQPHRATDGRPLTPR
jgi:hypothetical protein